MSFLVNSVLMPLQGKPNIKQIIQAINKRSGIIILGQNCQQHALIYEKLE